MIGRTRIKHSLPLAAKEIAPCGPATEKPTKHSTKTIDACAGRSSLIYS